jgi:hypothetical protein
VLEAGRILRHKEFGRIRLYKLNEQSSKVRAIQSLLDVWKESEIESKRRD